MAKRTDKLFEPGTLPPVGCVPERMYAWTIRNERLGEPINAFREEIVPVPELKKDEILVANMCAGINYNGIWAASGKPKNVIDNNVNYGDTKQDFHICGSESSGIVYAVGEDVTEFKVGDSVTVGASQFDENCPLIKSGKDPVRSPTFRVWGYEGNWGAFAQFSKVNRRQCAVIPDGMSWQEAAVFTAAGVPVYRMLTHWVPNDVKKGDVVLIYGGTGGVGSIAIQLCAYFGAVPVAVVSDDERGRICMKLGAKGYINRKNFSHWGRLDGYLDPEKQRKWTVEAMRFRKEIWKIAGERKSPAIVIEHPGRDTMPTSLFVCDSEGMVVTCGATSSYLADFDLRYLWLSQKRIQGSHSATPKDYEEYIEIIRKSGIRPYISRTFSWSDLPLAHQLLFEGKGSDGRMVINIVE
ncbi:MAG: crotonyl-CoA carboxylase/reductase [Ruminococcus flavefaciens]|nr:crotonyl-CoA carboxylase/reductase [Ruminococcus flavefaciens]